MDLSIKPSDLPEALALAPQAEILSLDCFDTLIWRNTHKPTDVFAELEAHGCSPIQRMIAEAAARRRAKCLGRDEVGIADIYACAAPGDPAAQARLIQAELDAEARHCFAFRPTVELMRRAKAAGLEVMIVSDTYLDEAMLRELIARAAGEDVAGLIDRVFCSSQYGRPKAGGLFKDVLKALAVAPDHILHIGDNKGADLTAPQALGIVAAHLEQFDASDVQRLRLEAAADRLIGGAPEMRQPVLQPHRAQLAVHRDRADATEALGYAVLGPILAAFARWIEAEAGLLEKQRGGRVLPVFLMRDGYLPMRAYEAAAPGAPRALAAEVSRFTSQAAAFATDEAVIAYAEKHLETDAPEYIAKQLLFTPEEAAQAIGRGPIETRRSRFYSEAGKPRVLGRVKARSQAFAARLVDYLRRVADPKPGDTLMLVDLGYNGTVQNNIDALLRRELGVHVAGRYLLLSESEVSSLDKRGFIDKRNYDTWTLNALTAYVAVLEQLCTASQGSVIDYDAAGPVRRRNDIKAAQSAVRERVQAAALRFVAAGPEAMHRPPASADEAAQRRAAVAALARLLFLPLPEELAVLGEFQHDVNLGSDETLELFDPAQAEAGLRRLGLFYMGKSRRMYLSAELRGQGLPLSLTLLAQSRFGLDLRQKDFSDHVIELPIMAADGQHVDLQRIEAMPTHAGYYTACIPIGRSRYAIGLQFGKLYDFVQVQEIGFARAASLWATEREGASTIPAQPVFEGVGGGPGGLMQMTGEEAFIMVPPPPDAGEDLVLVVVFRPIAERARAAAEPQAVAAA